MDFVDFLWRCSGPVDCDRRRQVVPEPGGRGHNKQAREATRQPLGRELGIRRFRTHVSSGELHPTAVQGSTPCSSPEVKISLLNSAPSKGEPKAKHRNSHVELSLHRQFLHDSNQFRPHRRGLLCRGALISTTMRVVEGAYRLNFSEVL